MTEKEILDLVDELVYSIRSKEKRRNKHLTDIEKLVIQLVIKHKSYSQIADELTTTYNIPYDENAIKSRVKKIRDDLKKAFQREGLPGDINKNNLISSMERYQKHQENKQTVALADIPVTAFAVDDDSQSFVEEHINTWKKSGYIYSAPGSVFFAGEHADIYGFPALIFPLPVRAYVHVVEDPISSSIAIDEFITKNPKNGKLQNVQYIDDYGRKMAKDQESHLKLFYKNVLSKFLKPLQGKSNYGLKLRILCNFPIACGMNSSGAISASLSSAIVNHYLQIDEFSAYFNIASSSTKNITQLISHLINNCFHNNKASGVETAACLYGRKGRHPLLFMSSKRSYLAGKLEGHWNPVNVGTGEEAVKNLLRVKTVLCDLAEVEKETGYFVEPPPFNLTVVYTGNAYKTALVLSDDFESSFNEYSRKNIDHIGHNYLNVFSPGEFQKATDFKCYEIAEEIYSDSQMTDIQKEKKLSAIYTEISANSLGAVSTMMTYAALSDWKTIPELMNTYQSLLSSSRISDITSESMMMKLRLSSFNYLINHGISIPMMGVKIAGSGGAGDFLILSLIEKETHQEFLSQNLDTSHVIHFDSTQLDEETWRQPVEGARCEN